MSNYLLTPKAPEQVCDTTVGQLGLIKYTTRMAFQNWTQSTPSKQERTARDTASSVPFGHIWKCLLQSKYDLLSV